MVKFQAAQAALNMMRVMVAKLQSGREWAERRYDRHEVTRPRRLVLTTRNLSMLVICFVNQTREMRLFIAVDLSEDAREAIAAEQKRIAAALGGTRTSVKWVKAEHMRI